MPGLTATIEVVEKGADAPKYNILSDVGGQATLADFLDFVKRSLIIISYETLKEEQAKGFDPDPVVAVDGKIGKPILKVNPLGSITFTSKASITQIIVDLFDGVWARSPVDSGLYRETHVMTFNGVPIAKSPDELRTWFRINQAKEFGKGDSFRLVNLVPYAAMLERNGITAGRERPRKTKTRDKKSRSGNLVRAANGAYFLTSRAVQRKYKYNAKIYFEFINGSQIKAGSFPTATKTGKPLRTSFANKKNVHGFKWKGAYTYPSIRVLITDGTV